ncbi:MAG: hypothetical protein OM95_07075 [Bdellovibrio sp. ArHS]|nr:MAG: hypothetical protein OM95_07075 [Bdellovibrio sp. ArHS]
METKGNDPIFKFCDAYGKVVNHGLSKREYFAAMAMQGLLSNQHITQQISISRLSSDDESKVFALISTWNADALIKALNEKKGE